MPEDFPPLEGIGDDMGLPPPIEAGEPEDGDPDLADAIAIAGGDEDMGQMLLDLIDRRLGGGGGLPL